MPAMTSSVELDTVNINNKLQILEENKQLIDEMITKIRSIIENDLYDAWGGNVSSDYANYCAKMDTFLNDVENVNEMLDSHISLLNSYMSNGKAIDEDYGSRTIEIN